MARTRTTAGGAGRAGASSVRAGAGGGTALRFMNRTISVYRGTTANGYGDISDVGTVALHTGIPAALAEVSDVAYDAATQRQQIVRSIKCVVPNWADILDTDTLMDESTGYFYLIESVEAEPGIGYYPARKIFTLRMRSGVTIASD